MLLLFYFTDYNELYPIHKWESENQSILNKYSIKIIYIIGKKFRIELNDKQVFNNITINRFTSDLKVENMGSYFVSSVLSNSFLSFSNNDLFISNDI